MSRIIIVGGGPAGMMAAVAAAACDCRVLLLEKNEKLGKKLFITGKGRCNVTNACSGEEFFSNIVTNPKFLYSSFSQFTNQDVMEFFTSRGCPLNIERGNRVFPLSNKSSDIIRTLQKTLAKESVEVWLQAEVTELLIREGACCGVKVRQKGRIQEELGEGVIIATGGCSYPATGSTGDGYRFAQAVGHQVKKPLPALVPLILEEEEAKELQGLSLKNVEARIIEGKKEHFREFGEMLFTHFGASGPIILSASSFIAKKLEKTPLTLVIDVKPALSREQLDERILRDFKEEKNKQFKNSLSHLLPAKLIPVMIRRSQISPEKPVNEITKKERQALVQAMKELSFTITGLRGFPEAIITQGGVSVKEIQPSTMESKKVSRLYFAGEVMDTDGITGGFNLQIAWSTGWAAGKAAARDGHKGAFG